MSFPNLNEIILNFITDSNTCDYDSFLEEIKFCYNKFKNFSQDKQLNIKFNFISQNYKPYEEICISDYIINENEEFFKNIFEPNVKQKVYIDYCSSNYSNIVKFKNYNIILDLYGCHFNEMVNFNFNNYNIYCTDYDSNYNIKINNINDVKKYFIIKNNIIFRFKTRYKDKIGYINDIKYFNKCYQLFKIRHTDLNYLNNYITNANHIIDNIHNYDINFNLYNLKIINMYKYGVKNIYSNNVLDFNIVHKKFDISSYISTNINCMLRYKNIRFDVERLCDEITYYIKY